MTIAQTIYKSGARYYPCPLCSKDHPSTTTVLDVIGSAALMGWSAKMGTKKLLMYQKEIEKLYDTYQISNVISLAKHNVEKTWEELGETSNFWKSGAENAKEAADHGTMAHASFEMLLTGKQVDKNSLSKESKNAFEVFEKFATDNKIETIDTERTFYNCSLGYAGTADWRGRIKDKLTLADWKTSTGIFEKNVVQAWANAIADEMQNSDNLYQQILIGRFGKDGSTDILIIPRAGLEGGFGGYEQARTLIQAVIPWFHYKTEWEKRFPWKKK